jgi:hypothetical protein
MSAICRNSLVAALVALAMAVTVSAAPVQATKSTAKTTTKTTTKSTAHSVTGTLEKYDAASNTITLQSGANTETLTVGSDTAIRMGASRMSLADLSGHTGQKVKVRYTEANGQRTAQSVQLEAPARSARAQNTSKPAAAKK